MVLFNFFSELSSKNLYSLPSSYGNRRRSHMPIDLRNPNRKQLTVNRIQKKKNDFVYTSETSIRRSSPRRYWLRKIYGYLSEKFINKFNLIK